ASPLRGSRNRWLLRVVSQHFEWHATAQLYGAACAFDLNARHLSPPSRRSTAARSSADRLRPALEGAAEAAATAGVAGEPLPSTDPDVLVEAIFQSSVMAARYWGKVVDDAGWMVDDRDAHRADEARYVIRRMADVADGTGHPASV